MTESRNKWDARAMRTVEALMAQGMNRQHRLEEWT